MFKFLSVLLVCIYGIQGQVPFVGKCPEIESVQQNFDVTKYLGKWYEAEKFFTAFELAGKCISAVYSANDDGTVKVHNQQINKLTNKASSIEGSAKLNGKDGEAKLVVNFPSVPVHVDAPYWVLETDYDNYSVVWSCSELPVISTKFAWILTRDRNPSAEILDKAHAVFDRLNLSRKELLKTDQNDCPNDE